jgi:hypothetical protein
MDQWPLFLFLAGLIATWTLITFKVMQAMLAKTEKRLEEKITERSDIVATYQCRVDEVERRMLDLKADLPLNYVRREDFIRHEVIISSKLDRIYDRIEKEGGMTMDMEKARREELRWLILQALNAAQPVGAPETIVKTQSKRSSLT